MAGSMSKLISEFRTTGTWGVLSVPMWGSRVRRGLAVRRGLILGSSGKTSKPAL